MYIGTQTFILRRNICKVNLKYFQHFLFPFSLPSNFEALTKLADVDLSKNGLTKIPDGLFTLSGLKRLNLSENNLKEISVAIGMYHKYL
jgi:Leucine-rich repeat (LRR) protein